MLFESCGKIGVNFYRRRRENASALKNAVRFSFVFVFLMFNVFTAT